MKKLNRGQCISRIWRKNNRGKRFWL